MKRRVLAPFKITLFTATLFSAALTAGTQANSAPYKPLPAGTVLDYGTWKCNVESSKGMETVCVDDNGKKLNLFGHFFAFGDLPENGYGGRPQVIDCPSGGNADPLIKIRKADIGGQARSGMARIWPLSPDKTADFDLELNLGEIEGRIDPLSYSMKVVGKTTLSIVGRTLSVWEVEGNTGSASCGTFSGNFDGYKERWWYSPELGAVVRYEYKTIWTRKSYQLKSISLPGGGPVASATQVQKPATSIAPAPTPAPRPNRVRREEPERTSTPEKRVTAIDKIAPNIVVPRAVINTSSVIVRLKGRVTDQSRVIEVSVNGVPIPLDSSGAFEVTRGVPIGKSRIVINATDEWGNSNGKQIVVIRTAQTGTTLEASINQPESQPAFIDKFADIKFGTYHALVIGNDQYRHVVKLDSAINDAKAVSNVLRDQYGFKVTQLLDATRNDILGSMAELRARLKPDDNLLIYYAGHGVVDSATSQGYWLPVDAEDRNPSNWISNSDLSDMLRGMSARHVMVVADSCYSGSLVRAATVRLNSGREKVAWVKRMLRKRARTALVSGGLEPVLDGGGGDHSVFAKAFLDALRNNNDVMDGQDLFDAIKRPVVLNADQTPQYTDIRRAGHDGGEFMFVRKFR